MTEATDAGEILYGEQRLMSLLNHRSVTSAQAAYDAVKADVDAFVGEAEQFDDITMLCLNYYGKVNP